MFFTCKKIYFLLSLMHSFKHVYGFQKKQGSLFDDGISLEMTKNGYKINLGCSEFSFKFIYYGFWKEEQAFIKDYRKKPLSAKNVKLLNYFWKYLANASLCAFDSQ